MENIISKIAETSQFLSEKGFDGADLGIVLGTGLGQFIDKMDVKIRLPYQAIPNFPAATVEFHKGQLILGTIGNKKMIIMQGRFHFYEGYSAHQITFPIRVMSELGIKQLFLTNAAGGINSDLLKGDLVLITDHINLQPENPLRGLHDPAFGNRFVDMFNPYDSGLMDRFHQAAGKLKINLKSGVYAAVVGPSLETRAEYKYLQIIGADLVGMSTVPEVIVANHIGLKCAAVSVVSDECHPGNLKPVNINDIIKVVGEADSIMCNLLAEVVQTF